MSKKIESAPNGRWRQKPCFIRLFSACLMFLATIPTPCLWAQDDDAASAVAGSSLRTAGPWPGSVFGIDEIRLLDTNRVLIRIAIQSTGSDSFKVQDLNTPVIEDQEMGENDPEPEPFSFAGAFLEEVETGAKFPLEAPKRQDGYLGRRYILVTLGPGSGSKLSTIFSLPPRKEGQEFRLHLPGASEPISKIVIPRPPDQVGTPP
jgi:hypothetical protein